MIQHGRIGEATDAFERFVHALDDDDLRRSATELAKVALEDRKEYLAHRVASSAYLQTYLGEWVRDGAGVEWTGGDFGVYSRTVLNIADGVLRGTINCDYWGDDPYKREIIGIHDPEGDEHDFLEPTGYAVAAYRWDRRRSGLLVQEPISPIA